MQSEGKLYYDKKPQQKWNKREESRRIERKSSKNSLNCSLLSHDFDEFYIKNEGDECGGRTVDALKRRLKEVEVERDTVSTQSRSYRIELARILSIINPNVDTNWQMNALLIEVERIVRSVDQKEKELAKSEIKEWSLRADVDRSLNVMKEQEQSMNDMMRKANRLEDKVKEKSDQISLLKNCFEGVSLKFKDVDRESTVDYSTPFSACSEGEKRKRVLAVESELEKVVGKDSNGREREIEKSKVLAKMRDRLNVKEEIVINKWSVQEGMHLQCLEGWSEAQMERLRSVLVKKKMNFLPSQRSMREFRKAQWDSNEWEVKYDEKGNIESEQCTNIRKNLTEQIQKAELSGNLDRNEWGGHVGYCIVFDAGGGTTKIAGTVMNSHQPNSTDHVVLLGMYRGGDGYDEMKKHLPEVIYQINQLVEHPEIEIVNMDGIEEIVQIEVFITADYKAICEVMGHGGPCTLYNCILCKRKSGRTENTGQVLIGNDKRLMDDLSAEPRYLNDYVDSAFSVHQTPLFKIALDHIIPPALHMIMGLIKPFVSSLEREMFERDTSDMGYCNVRNIDGAKIAMSKVKDERDFHRDVLVNMKAELSWLQKGMNELKESDKWKDSQRLGAGYCSQKCVMRGKMMKSLPIEYKECMTCTSCDNQIHLYCHGAVTLSTIEIVKADPSKFRCYVCRRDSVETRIEEGNEMIEAITNEIEECEKLVERCEKDLASWNCIINQNSGPNQLKFDEMLEKLRISRQKYFNAFNGNDVRRMLKEENVDKLLSISNNPQKDEMMNGMKALGRIMGAAKAKLLTEQEIDQFKNDVKVYKQSMVTCFPRYSVTPKCHLLLSHVIPFIEKWHTWGLASEQAIEAMHATVNNIMRRFNNLKNEEHKWRLVTRELSMRRKLRDTFTIFE